VYLVDGGVIGTCSLSGTGSGGRTKEACAAWYSALLTYKVSKIRVRLYFNPDNPGNGGVTGYSGLGNWVTG
jgi:hypothetical protein